MEDQTRHRWGAVFFYGVQYIYVCLRKKLTGLFCGDCGGCFLTSFRIYIYTPHTSSGRTAEIAPAAPAPLAKSKPAYCVRTSNRGSPINKPSIEMNGSKQPEFIVPRYQRF